MHLMWREIGNQVYVRRHESYDLNIGLIAGTDRCLIIDSREHAAAAAELAEEVRAVTSVPWLVVNTHAHFDHTFGNAELARQHGSDLEIWAHERCVSNLRDYGDIQAHVAGLAAEIALPNRTLSTDATLDLGERPVTLHHPGLAHTDHDIVVHDHTSGIVFAGDIVEQGAPPAFEDSFPLDWPAALDRILELASDAIVPGHGDVVDRAYVARQRDDITAMARIARTAWTSGLSAAEIPAAGPYPREPTTVAIERAYRQLRGDPPYDPPDQIREALGIGPR